MVDGYQKGRKATMGGELEDPWLLFWEAWDGRVGSVLLRKVKAHATRRERESMGARLFAGNREVDRLAKQAAELDAGFGRDQAVKEASQKVEWALHNIGWWHERIDDWNDMQPMPTERPPPRGPPGGARGPPPGPGDLFLLMN